MQARDIMTREVFTVTPEMLVSDLDKFFLQHWIDSAPVVSEDGKFLGLVTKSQLFVRDRKGIHHLPTAISLLTEACHGNIQDLDDDAKKTVMKRVEEVYVREVYIIEEGTPLKDIVTMLVEKGVTILPVLQGDKLVGIVGKTDVLRTLLQKKNHKPIQINSRTS